MRKNVLKYDDVMNKQRTVVSSERRAVLDVAESAYDVGLGTMGIAASPLPGPAGNVEYFLWLRRGAPAVDSAAVDRAIEMGPA
jgi:23S rRNA (cytidine1920-2'-O)/16S rRNA (cytidine1409-2'-O)-methyltransferase